MNVDPAPSPAAHEPDSWTTQLTELALKLVPTFKYALAGVAFVLVAGTLLNWFPNTAVGFVAAAGCAVFGLLFFFLERVAADPDIQDLVRKLIAIIFWAVTLSFVTLLVIFLIWTGVHVWRSFFPPPPVPVGLTAEEQKADELMNDIDEMANKWEAALRGSKEQDLEEVVTRSNQVGDDLEDRDSDQLSYARDLMRHRYAAIAYLMACSLADLQGNRTAAAGYCKQGLVANKLAFGVADDIHKLRKSQTAKHWSWLQVTDQRSRLFRNRAQLNAMLFRLTADAPYRSDACTALGSISIGYRHHDSPTTSIVLTRDLRLTEGGQCADIALLRTGTSDASEHNSN